MRSGKRAFIIEFKFTTHGDLCHVPMIIFLFLEISVIAAQQHFCWLWSMSMNGVEYFSQKRICFDDPFGSNQNLNATNLLNCCSLFFSSAKPTNHKLCKKKNNSLSWCSRSWTTNENQTADRVDWVHKTFFKPKWIAHYHSQVSWIALGFFMNSPFSRCYLTTV